MSLLDAARRLVRRLPGGIETNAQRFDVTPSTLRHQLAGTGGYRFSLENAELATQFAIEQGVDNPLEIVNTLAKNCGAMVIPLPGLYETGGGTMKDLAAAAHEFAQFVSLAALAPADGVVTANELSAVTTELSHLIGCAQRVRAGLAEMHEAGKPKAESPHLDVPVIDSAGPEAARSSWTAGPGTGAAWVGRMQEA
ncbi:phage regulatory CII family protein [Acidovorax sp. NCPPB 3576]|uniref:phage regulatory CII family protein n=1 Tax=Acidovorax sp. NCPPB 3576 TaxID=2940488 RepID=UPI00234AC658|nr:phage regulatory CII family protein [Acidovorax sp. NCPPB 3576]WCM88826.1 hypothetical protein M5C98_01865 [Acidovorax sp. NCPPB 3576]